MQIGVESERAVENKRVFVVETGEVSGTALQFMLADECEAHVFDSLEAAERKSREWPADLVLLGAEAVARDGVAAVARALALGTATRLLVVGDGAQDAGVRLALESGAHAMLLRPLELGTVRRKVDAQLGRRAALAIPVMRA